MAVYDDRLEVTSPGGLYNGLTFEEAMQGHSKLRNRVIANIFGQIGLVEAWGTGIRRIQDAAREYDLPEPEFIEMPETFRVNLYRKGLPMEERKNVSETSVEYRHKNKGILVEMDKDNAENSVKFGESSVKFGDISINMTQKRILQLIEENNQISAAVIAEKMSLSVRAIEKNMKELRIKGMLVRHGSARGGYWEVARK